MNSTTDVLEVRNVSVRYRTRHSFFRHDHYTALDDVSFTVRKGETLGIIGVNGCGKSTLMRVLADIYGVDSGEVVWHCQQVSLLSLALGFDAQLSGRDNAIISGMLLGDRRSTVLGRLGEIIEFADLGEFINEPIKTYSSGMRARLAFSVALNMKAELLLIDEVLGVGDARFNQKATAAMTDKIHSEQTVVLVSHSMPQVRQLCDRVLWLDQGKLRMIGETADVLGQYQIFVS